MNIDILVDEINLKAELNDSPTAKKIADALPFEGRGNKWGEEIYLEIPVESDLSDDAVQDVEVGTLAYWPPGKALCLFFGPTPVSRDDRPRAYSPVNIVGRIIGDAEILKKADDGAMVKIQN
jgi:hypothetical protein